MRKYLTAVTCLIALALVTGCGGGKKTTGGLSEDDFVEMNAKIMVISFNESADVMESKINAVLKEYGMTQEKMNELSSGPEGEAMRAKLGPRIMQRAQELGYKERQLD